MDALLLPGETPHPSDNIGAAVASAQYADRSGKELITGVGIAYEVHGEMAAKAPGRDIGWDHIHVTFGSVSAASKLMGLDYDQIRNAVGIATAAYNPLRVTRTGEISMWKGIASANLARNAVYTAMLAENGMEGPVDAFEGQKGWKEIVQERDFQVDFTPCERINEVMTKKYMAGTHAQTAIEGLIELVERDSIDLDRVEEIRIETYESAKHVMGGGEGDRHVPENREQADHSIPYTLAAAALDGQLMKEQYELERIRSDDVRELMKTITIEEDPELTERFDAGSNPTILPSRRPAEADTGSKSPRSRAILRIRCPGTDSRRSSTGSLRTSIPKADGTRSSRPSRRSKTRYERPDRPAVVTSRVGSPASRSASLTTDRRRFPRSAERRRGSHLHRIGSPIAASRPLAPIPTRWAP